MKPARERSTVSPRASAKVPDAVIADLLGALRRQFLRGCEEKRFFAHERPLLVQAITFPAAFLVKRCGAGTVLPWPKYQEIVFTVMAAIGKHGAPRAGGSFGRYFLTAIQRHMEHHWEGYYAESKRAANAVEETLRQLTGGARPAVDSTVADLARIHAALNVKAGRKKKLAGSEQPGLF